MKFVRTLSFFLFAAWTSIGFADHPMDHDTHPEHVIIEGQREANAATLSHLAKMKKIYMDPSHIAITTSGIYCHVNDMWLLVEAVQYDAQGIFVVASDKWSTRWECPKCHHDNSAWACRCQNCGYEPRH